MRHIKLLFPCLLLGVALLLPATSFSTRAKPAVSGVLLTIYANKTLGRPTLRHGFSHGLMYQPGGDYGRTIGLISGLKPRSWRFSNHRDIYDFVVGEAQLPQRFGTETVYVIQDAFNTIYGYKVEIGSPCATERKNCFPTYDAFKSAWIGVVNKVMTKAAEKNAIVDYFDVFGEPTTGDTKLGGLTPEQLHDTFKVTHDIVRTYRPYTKIVGPSLAAFEIDGLKAFLDYVAENRLRLDAVSWHEFGALELVPAHADEVRKAIRARPALCDPSCPKLHVNEYMGPRFHLNPGYSVLGLSFLERARVDHANRACWDVESSGERWSDCWAGINGLLLADNKTPQPLYWVFKAYADMAGTRLLARSSDVRRVTRADGSTLLVQGTAAIASRDDAKRELRVLVGKFWESGRTDKVAVTVNAYPYRASSVSVAISRVPGAGNHGHVVQSLRSLPKPETSTVRVKKGRVVIAIERFTDGDAYSIVIRSQRRPSR